MSTDFQKISARMNRNLGGLNMDEIAKRLRAIVGPSKIESGLAKDAMDKLKSGIVPLPSELAALELVIRTLRPAPLSQNGALPALDPEASKSFSDWETFRAKISSHLYAIGRIDRVVNQGGNTFQKSKGVGTGFLVTHDVLVTNRHVLEELSAGTNRLEKGQAVVLFKHEYQTPDEPPVPIIDVVAFHPAHDIALLRVETPAQTNRTPLEIDGGPLEDGTDVVAIGYPFNDPERNPIFISAIFGNDFGVKRASPGEIIDVVDDSLYHDCTTLGGNSGSPVLSMKSAKVVGLHRSGYFTFRNEAVNGAFLKTFISAQI